MHELRVIFEEMGFDVNTVRFPQAAALYALARLYSVTARDLSAVYKRVGLTITSFNLLMLVQHGKDRESLTQQALSDKLVVTESDTTKVIDQLEKRSLVRRLPGHDRRSKRLTITEKGVKLLDEVWPRHVEAMERLAQAIQPHDAKVLAEILVRLRRVREAP